MAEMGMYPRRSMTDGTKQGAEVGIRNGKDLGRVQWGRRKGGIGR